MVALSRAFAGKRYITVDKVYSFLPALGNNSLLGSPDFAIAIPCSISFLFTDVITGLDGESENLVHAPHSPTLPLRGWVGGLVVYCSTMYAALCVSTSVCRVRQG